MRGSVAYFVDFLNLKKKKKNEFFTISVNSWDAIDWNDLEKINE